MARPIDYCYSEDHSGSCLNVPGDPYLFPGWFHGTDAGNNPNPQIPGNLGNPNASGGSTPPFPGSPSTLASLFSGTADGSAGILGNEGIWWLVLGAVALIALSGKKGR